MKITNRNGKKDAGGKHNDRQFDLDSAPHINKDKVKDNKYFTYTGDYTKTLYETEMEFYETYFSDHIKAQNARNDSYKKSSRNKTVEDYYSSYRTRLEDKILQVGDKNDHISGEELWECALDYAQKFNDLFGDHCKIVDMALHVDEATPHVHIRRAWIAQDKDGYDCISQQMALDQMGFTRPDPHSPQGKYNNPVMVFTKTDAALFENVCIEHGIEFDKSRPVNREHLSVLDYKRMKITEEIEDLERTRDTLKSDMEDAVAEEIIKEMEDVFKDYPFLFNNFEHELIHIEDKKAQEKLKLLLKIYQQAIREMKRSLQRADEEDRLEDEFANSDKTATSRSKEKMKSFIKSKGLEEEYRDFISHERTRV